MVSIEPDLAQPQPRGSSQTLACLQGTSRLRTSCQLTAGCRTPLSPTAWLQGRERALPPLQKNVWPVKASSPCTRITAIRQWSKPYLGFKVYIARCFLPDVSSFDALKKTFTCPSLSPAEGKAGARLRRIRQLALGHPGSARVPPPCVQVSLCLRGYHEQTIGGFSIGCSSCSVRQQTGTRVPTDFS